VAERDAAGADQRLRQATELYGRSDPLVEGRAALLLATVLRMQGHLDEARALLGRFRTAEGPGVDRIVRAEALGEARHICEELGASSWLSALEPTSKVVT
jgi:hypothetical protein